MPDASHLSESSGYRVGSGFVSLQAIARRWVVEFDGPVTARDLQARLSSRGLRELRYPRAPLFDDHWAIELDLDPTSRTEQVRTILQTLAGVRFAAPVYMTAEGGEVVPLNVVDLKFRTDVSRGEVEEVLAANDLELLREPHPDSGYFAHRARFRAVNDVYRMIDRLDRIPGVEWASLSTLSARRLHQGDPYFPQQYYLSNPSLDQGVPVDINVVGAWAHATGTGIRVAVLDDGVDVAHGNSGGGYAGDLVGAFTGQHVDMMPGMFPDSELLPFQNDTHGTAVAGIIGMRANNGRGGRGVAPDVTLSVARIFRGTYPPFSTPPNYAGDHLVADAINWAWSVAGADVINNSWGGGPFNLSIVQAVASATTQGRGGRGAVVVFSAGNTSARSLGIIGAVEFPASLSALIPGVIAVGAINSQGLLTDYTPGTGAVDLVAPSGQQTGVGCFVGDVVATDIYGSPGCSNGPGGDINYSSSFSGTSASAPQVAGAAALLLQREPQLTAAQVRSRLKSTAKPWYGFGAAVGAGKLDVMAALFPPPVAVIMGPVSVPASQPCGYGVQVTGGASPYSITWKRDAQIVGSGPYVSIASPPSGSFTLDVFVTDQHGSVGSASMSVDVDPWLFSCSL